MVLLGTGDASVCQPEQTKQLNQGPVVLTSLVALWGSISPRFTSNGLGRHWGAKLWARNLLYQKGTAAWSVSSRVSGQRRETFPQTMEEFEIYAMSNMKSNQRGNKMHQPWVNTFPECRGSDLHQACERHSFSRELWVHTFSGRVLCFNVILSWLLKGMCSFTHSFSEQLLIVILDRGWNELSLEDVK